MYFNIMVSFGFWMVCNYSCQRTVVLQRGYRQHNFVIYVNPFIPLLHNIFNTIKIHIKYRHILYILWRCNTSYFCTEERHQQNQLSFTVTTAVITWLPKYIHAFLCNSTSSQEVQCHYGKVELISWTFYILNCIFK